MKKLTIIAVDVCPELRNPPKSPKARMAAEKDLKEAWEKAKKLGAIECNAVTAIENVRNSGGIYMVKPEAKIEVEVTTPGLKDPLSMKPEELKEEMIAWGKPPRKKMTFKDAAAFVQKLRDDATGLIEDQGDIDPDE